MPKPTAAVAAHRKLRCAAPAIILSVILLYAALIFICELPLVSRRPLPPSLLHRLPLHVKSSEIDRETTNTTTKPTQTSPEVSISRSSRRSLAVSSLSLHHLNHSSFYTTNRSDINNDNSSRNTTVLYDLRFIAARAWAAGLKLMKELESSPAASPTNNISASVAAAKQQSCRSTISLVSGTPEATSWGKENRSVLLELPCGLTYGSHITLVATPEPAHGERDPSIFPTSSKARIGGPDEIMVSQFLMELQGLKAVDGEEPPKILHYNPRLKGDWSGESVIEQNSCFRMTWATPLRCEGWESGIEEERVDGLVKCEKWLIKEDIETIKFLNQMNRKTSEVHPGWPYPFEEGKMFVLTLSAGFEGYHISVNGRHVSSFAYRVGFDLEDATGLSVNGDLDVHSIVAASLPTSHPSFAPQGHLEMSSLWQAPELPAGGGPIDLFIGVLSAGNHFLERMAARKSWMSSIRNSPNVVARFFVAMHGRKEINVELKKEAEFFGDIILVPFLDSYDLVILKTLAISDYGLRTVSAKFIMKCDDDTFVRVDSVMDQLKFHGNRSLYIGNINYHTKPLRRGKWAVTPEEWPEEEYPPYANGPGYVISSDIAKFIVSEFQEHRLKLFKMEDVSLGMWVQQFNASTPVKYVHSLRFCQYGCFDGYITAHYQSPKQMLCMWEKLQTGRAECCNIR